MYCTTCSKKKNGTRSCSTPPGSIDTDKNDSQEVVNGNWRMDKERQGLTPLQKVQSGKQSYSAKECCELFARYFISEVGQVPWQMKMI